MANLALERVREALTYNAESGKLYWRVSRARGAKAGDEAGFIHGNGYRTITFERARYQAHRIVWLFETGEMPKGSLDHVNGNRADNRISNLRAATHAENMQNMGRSKANRSGYMGVCWDKAQQKWRADIQIDKRQKFLGAFTDKEAAAAAYAAAKSQLHTFQPVARE